MHPALFPIISIIIGVLILIYPRILAYVVALWFIIQGAFALASNSGMMS